MSSLDRNLLPDERILFRTKKHKIIFFYPVIITMLAILATSYMHANPILIKLEWAPWVVVFVFWAYTLLEYATSEFAVTTKRVMMREGFFNKHSTEMRVTTISQVNVDQSIIGQLLNYGTVSLNAFGAFDAFPLIARPYDFQRFVNDQLDKLTTRPSA